MVTSFVALATAAALSTNNLRDARFSCSIVGDSLLAGLVAGGEGGFEPVAKVVVNELRKLILTPVDVRVSAEPLRTAGQVEVALSEELKSRTPGAVVILAGTNDLWSCDADATFKSLKSMYDNCAQAGVRHVVGITLPPFTADATQWFSIVDLPQRIEATRSAVNDIRGATRRPCYWAYADCENDAVYVYAARRHPLHARGLPGAGACASRRRSRRRRTQGAAADGDLPA